MRPSMKTTLMRKDFCVFILTHGRPKNVRTVQILRKHGYTGKVYIVIDDEDQSAEEYKRIYGDDVLVFSKDEVARYTDQFDNSSDRRGILWARNVCWGLASQVGCKYFAQLDDDYTHFSYRRTGRGHRLSSSVSDEYHSWVMRSLDTVFEAFVRLVESTPVKTIALSQGGDHVGGAPKRIRFKRKAMNSFVCSVDKPIRFLGRFNDDVTAYVSLGSTGSLFFTDMGVYLGQLPTQLNSGGTSNIYQNIGTYVKSFYTVMAAPSCVTVRPLDNHRASGPRNPRPHHKINWNKAVPKILRQ
jgi:hypothetical protein